MSVRIDKSGPVTTVLLHRPEVRNAVDEPTAQALAEAFRAFDSDPEARVGVPGAGVKGFVTGAGGGASGAGVPTSRLTPLRPAPRVV